jgi:hypothetical protein
MDKTRPNNQLEIIPLETAAQILAVSVDTLLKWNENNILKPTINHTGVAGYRREQINQFLAINKPSQENHIPSQNPISVEPEVFVPSVINHRTFPAIPALAFILSFSATLFSSAIILKILPGGEENKDSVLSSQISKYDLTERTAPPLPIPPNNKNGSDDNLGNEDLAALKDGFAAYAQTANKETADPVFDNNGNIKGKTANQGALASVIGTNGMIQATTPVKPAVDPNILIALFAMGVLSIPIIFRKQPEILPSDSQVGFDEQKILEVNQKTDGTVVLCFSGQEYRVSKPELDSESDQFIERLMGLVTPGTKEIDYDALKDNEISLSAPLSKLVTRLGFIGIKRDLFFPRTSKNRVLFRRYLTQKDLASMNLTIGQISGEFQNSN